MLALTGVKVSSPGISGGTGVTFAHPRNSESLHGPHAGGLGNSSILHSIHQYQTRGQGNLPKAASNPATLDKHFPRPFWHFWDFTICSELRHLCTANLLHNAHHWLRVRVLVRVSCSCRVRVSQRIFSVARIAELLRSPRGLCKNGAVA